MSFLKSPPSSLISSSWFRGGKGRKLSLNMTLIYIYKAQQHLGFPHPGVEEEAGSAWEERMRGLQGRAESGACLRVGAKWGLPPDQSLTLSPTLNLLSSSFSSSSYSFLIPFSFFSSLYHPPSRVYQSLTQASTYSTLPHFLLHFSSFHSLSTPHKGEGM